MYSCLWCLPITSQLRSEALFADLTYHNEHSGLEVMRDVLGEWSSSGVLVPITDMDNVDLALIIALKKDESPLHDSADEDSYDADSEDSEADPLLPYVLTGKITLTIDEHDSMGPYALPSNEVGEEIGRRFVARMSKLWLAQCSMDDLHLDSVL